MIAAPSTPLAAMGLAFGVFAVLLLVLPLYMVGTKARPWRSVLGLWIAGWGFLLIALGTCFADRGWGNLAVFGVMVSGAGHLVQRRNSGGPA